MLDHENETLRERVADLERKVHDQTDEILCLRATIADILRRISTLENTNTTGKNHYTHSQTIEMSNLIEFADFAQAQSPVSHITILNQSINDLITLRNYSS